MFAELAFGGMLAVAVPPFFKVERGFYKSSAAVYLAAGLLTAVGFGFLATRGAQPGAPSTGTLWLAAALWLAFCLTLAIYFLTLWNDNGLLRARAYTATLMLGLAGIVVNALVLMPPGQGFVVAVSYALSALFSSFVLGLVSVGMLFGHWYLIDPNLPVEYLQTIVRLIGIALVAELIVIVLVIAAMSAGADAALVRALFESHLTLVAMRLLLGPAASIALAWMTWQTLKIPQTMAATGLLYIAVMSVLVGELLGRFILFRTTIPL